jgi:hypothetical protein
LRVEICIAVRRPDYYYIRFCVRNAFQKRRLPLYFGISASMQNISLFHGEIQMGKTVKYTAWRQDRYTEIQFRRFGKILYQYKF